MIASHRLRLTVGAPRLIEAPALNVRSTARARRAVRLTLRDHNGIAGTGEALPLPGFHRDSAAEAMRALQAVAAWAAAAGGLALPGALAPAVLLEEALAPFDALLAGAPSARFALECALVDLLARRAGVGAAQWLAAGLPLQPVAVSVLLPDDDSAPAAAAGAAARGYGVVKLKIALPGRSVAAEDARLAAVRAAVDSAVRLRLDANGALAPAAVTGRLKALARFNVELVEEPCGGPALLALPGLALPWAADESLADPALAAALLAMPPGRAPAALVLKPALLGLARCLTLAEAGAARGMGVIVTHAFDGDIGFAAARALAAALPVAPWPCGLAPHAGLTHPWPDAPWLAPPAGPGLGPATAEAEG